MPWSATACNSMEHMDAARNTFRENKLRKPKKESMFLLFRERKPKRSSTNTPACVAKHKGSIMERKMQHVNSIKGPSWLALLTHFDIVGGTSVDYMHCVLEGVVKLLLNLWFNRSFIGKPYTISRHVCI